MSNIIPYVSAAGRELAIRQIDATTQVATVGDKEVMLFPDPFDISLVQPGAVKEHKELAPYKGKFLVAGSEEASDTLTLLPVLDLGRHRRYFAPYDSGSKELLCMSHDALVPAKRPGMTPVSDICGVLKQGPRGSRIEPVCPKAVWPEEQGKRAECPERATAIFYDLDRDVPVRLQFHGTAMGAYNALRKENDRYVNLLKLKYKLKWEDYRYNYVLKLTAEDEGTFFRMRFLFVEAPEYNAGSYLPLLEHYLKQITDRIATAEAARLDTAKAAVQPDGKAGGQDGQVIDVTPQEATSEAVGESFAV